MKLIYAKRHIKAGLQKLNLIRILVGNAEISHLARCFELVKGSCNLLGLAQCVGAVEQKHVDIIRSEPFKAAVDGCS